MEPVQVREEEKHVLVGVTGSVAAIKIPELVRKLAGYPDLKLNVQVVSTKAALHFFHPQDLPVKCYTDADEWTWSTKGDPVLHIEVITVKPLIKDPPRRVQRTLFEVPNVYIFFDLRTKDEVTGVLYWKLRKWADVFVIAPLDANTMAKMASGLCDNLLTCVVRAWDCKFPLVYCPAMNTFMWDHPLTTSHNSALARFGYIEVPPISKLLACGDQGIGAMASVDNIVKAVVESL